MPFFFTELTFKRNSGAIGRRRSSASKVSSGMPAARNAPSSMLPLKPEKQSKYMALIISPLHLV